MDNIEESLRYRKRLTAWQQFLTKVREYLEAGNELRARDSLKRHRTRQKEPGDQAHAAWIATLDELLDHLGDGRLQSAQGTIEGTLNVLAIALKPKEVAAD